MSDSESQVLVVDDDPIVLAQLEERLSEMGYDVTTRDRALGTSSWILKHKPWLVVLDLEMPALSGQELADFLRSKGLDTPVIIHSGKSEEELRRVVQSTGAVGAIQKGLSDAQFGLQFNNLVKAARTRKSLPARRRGASASRREDIGGLAATEKRSSTGARRLADLDEDSERRTSTGARRLGDPDWAKRSSTHHESATRSATGRESFDALADSTAEPGCLVTTLGDVFVVAPVIDPWTILVEFENSGG